MITASDGRPEAQTISAICITYRKEDPREIFIDMKDATYPVKAFALKLLGLGGNWVGPGAINDGNPKGTVSREIKEELSVRKPLGKVDDAELAQILGQATSTRNIDRNNVEPSEADLDDLEIIKRTIVDSLTHFGDYIEFVPKMVFDRTDPENKRLFDRAEGGEKTSDFQGLVSVWIAGLEDNVWTKLVRLQSKFGNLSNESISVITSLGEIVERKIEAGWGQDRVLRDFFQSFGFNETNCFPLIPDVEATPTGKHFETFEEYLEHYAVVRHP